MITIIILIISCYLLFGELTYQWTKEYIPKGRENIARICDIFLWPIVWIIGLFGATKK